MAAPSMKSTPPEESASLEECVSGAEKPFWVILSSLEHFISGHDSLAEAESEAQRLNHHAQLQGCLPHYTTKPRLQREDYSLVSS